MFTTVWSLKWIVSLFLLLNPLVKCFVAKKGTISGSEVLTATKTIARTTTFSVWSRLFHKAYNKKYRRFSYHNCHPNTPSEEQNDTSSNYGSDECSECVPSEPHPHSSVLCSSSGPITLDDLSDENIVKIVRMECSDADANVLAWRCLGYVYDENTGTWDASAVFPKWYVFTSETPRPITKSAYLSSLVQERKISTTSGFDWGDQNLRTRS